jgi:hypothetical protein
MCLRMLCLTSSPAEPREAEVAPRFFLVLTILVSLAWLALGLAYQSPGGLPLSRFGLGALVSGAAVVTPATADAGPLGRG